MELRKTGKISEICYADFCRPAKIIPDCKTQPQRYLHLDFLALFTIRVMQTVYAVLAIELVFFNPALGERPQGVEGEREKRKACAKKNCIV